MQLDISALRLGGAESGSANQPSRGQGKEEDGVSRREKAKVGLLRRRRLFDGEEQRFKESESTTRDASC